MGSYLRVVFFWIALVAGCLVCMILDRIGQFVFKVFYPLWYASEDLVIHSFEIDDHAEYVRNVAPVGRYKGE